MIGDEVWSWSEREPTLLGAMRTALIKNPESKLLLISTAAASLATPLGALRARALGLPTVKRRGAHIDARGDGLRWLEWSLPDDADPDDARAVKRCNPAPWISIADLAAQRRRVTDAEYLQFHCCRWGVGERAWLPPGAWAACAGKTHFEPGERIWVGVDVGGTRSDSAVVWVNEQMHIGVETWSGDGAVLEVAAFVAELAERFTIVEACFDPWRAQQMSLEWEQRGIPAVQFNQSDSRMIPASQALYDAVIQRRLVHPNHPGLNQHVSNAVARHGRRGWRLDRPNRNDRIDGAIALCMAIDRAAVKPEPVELLGWL